MKTIRYTDQDPRSGSTATLDDALAQRLIDSGAATEVSGEDATATQNDAERDAAKRVGGDPEEATRQLQRNADATKATAPSPAPAPTTSGSGAPGPAPAPSPSPAPTTAPAPSSTVSGTAPEPAPAPTASPAPAPSSTR